MRGISWLAENLLASQEGLCSKEQVIKLVYRLKDKTLGKEHTVCGPAIEENRNWHSTNLSWCSWKICKSYPCLNQERI